MRLTRDHSSSAPVANPAPVTCSQLKRCFYSSRAQLLADANMIVAAARTYHCPPPGIRRMSMPNSNVVKVGETMVGQAERDLKLPDALMNLEYWEARVVVSM
jgi:hypothetical protein